MSHEPRPLEVYGAISGHPAATPEQFSAVEALCARYGSQLELLKLRGWGPGPAALRRIVRACPSVEIEITHATDDELLAMGKTIRRMRLLEYQNEPRARRIGDACRNLGSLRLLCSWPRRPHFQALLDTPKPLLDLTVSGIEGGAAEALVGALAAKVSTLERFSYSGAFPGRGSAVLQRFAAGNQSLRNVDMRADNACPCCPEGVNLPDYSFMVGVVSVSFELGLNWLEVVASFINCPKVRNSQMSLSFLTRY